MTNRRQATSTSTPKPDMDTLFDAAVAMVEMFDKDMESGWPEISGHAEEYAGSFLEATEASDENFSDDDIQLIQTTLYGHFVAASMMAGLAVTQTAVSAFVYPVDGYSDTDSSDPSCNLVETFEVIMRGVSLSKINTVRNKRIAGLSSEEGVTGSLLWILDEPEIQRLLDTGVPDGSIGCTGYIGSTVNLGEEMLKVWIGTVEGLGIDMNDEIFEMPLLAASALFEDDELPFLATMTTGIINHLVAKMGPGSPQCGGTPNDEASPPHNHIH